jgi:hypothetical protein
MIVRVAIALFWISLAANLGFMVAAADWWMLPAALGGWYLADLASGIVHMVMDYRPCRPGNGLGELFFYTGSRESADYLAKRDAAFARIGPLERLTFDFKNHHPRPDALGRRSLRVQIGSTVVVASLPLSLLLNLVCALWPVPGFAIALIVAFLIGGTFAQYFHGTLHRAENPPVVLLLRRLGLLMTPAAHGLHHATLKRDFATNNGWSNPLLNPIFAALHARGMLRDDGLEPN